MADDIVARLAIAAQYLRLKQRAGKKTVDVDTSAWARLAEQAALEIQELRTQLGIRRAG